MPVMSSFNSGEISKRAGGRIDLAKYASGLETCLNALPLPHGGITRRPGTQYIASCKVAAKKARLLPFEFSTEQAYIIEAGEDYFRFYMDGGQIQSFDSDVKLCLHGDGLDNSTTISDATSQHTITSVGAKVSTAQKKFGTGSLIFDGTSDYCTADDHADWFFSTGAFSIGAWVYPDSVTDVGICGQYVDNNNFWYLRITAGKLVFVVKSAAATIAEYTTVNTISTGVWTHVEIGRSSTNFYMFINGVLQTPTVGTAIGSGAVPDLAAVLEIGAIRGHSVLFDGYIDEFIINKGSVLNSASFTPMTVAYPLSSGWSVYEITSTFLEEELPAIKYTQSADVLYLAHKAHRASKLTRTGHAAWTLTDISFAWPPCNGDDGTTWRPANVTLTPSAETGNITVVSSKPMFDANWVYDGIKISDGFFNVASVQSATTCTGTVVENLSTTAATTSWIRSDWNYDEGYPACVMFFEERLYFACITTKLQTVWGSVSGDYENFDDMVGTTIADTDAVTFTISSDQVNAIRWMCPTKKLVLGTTGGQWLMYGANDEGISPSNVKCDAESPYPVADIMPIKIGNSVIFVQRAGKLYGKKLRELGYNFSEDAWKANELTILAEHLTRNNDIIEMDYQMIPNQVIWCIRDDGGQIALTYLKEHEVIGWSRHEFTGDVESEADIPGANEDESWKIINRTIGGSTVRYIERLHETWDGDDVQDAFYLDSGLTYNGASTTTISGLSHLEGEQVAILADGIHVNNATVSSGAITLTTAASKVQVGLPMTTDIKTLRTGPLEIQGQIKRIAAVVIRFFETCGKVCVGSSASDMDEWDLGTTPITEDRTFTMPTGYDTDGQVFIRKTDPYPMTILAIIPVLENFNAVDRV